MPTPLTPDESEYLEIWRRRPSYFVVSPYKTATTTVGRALADLGAGRAVMPYCAALPRARRDAFARWEARMAGFDDAAAFLASRGAEVRRRFARVALLMTPFDIFADAPFGHGQVHPVLIRALAPRARFIWVDRPLQDWLESVRHWEETHPETYPGCRQWRTRPDTRIAQVTARRDRAWRNFRAAADAFPEDCLELRMEELRDHGRLAAFCGVRDPGRPIRPRNVSRRA
ncbi:sulfotransferase [Jannaschia sp. S6380]|uniref:sulfotransferase n=1 Tax=Jannaschia sp. S6380 TaxID=2926408 RepID=UPI001FF4D613|nr:sulfotransferase [Jannaschia sp. S6380]MCK0168322.1 sulfotransferase [Jannaschia sp. S6380]